MDTVLYIECVRGQKGPFKWQGMTAEAISSVTDLIACCIDMAFDFEKYII